MKPRRRDQLGRPKEKRASTHDIGMDLWKKKKGKFLVVGFVDGSDKFRGVKEDGFSLRSAEYAKSPCIYSTVLYIAVVSIHLFSSCECLIFVIVAVTIRCNLRFLTSLCTRNPEFICRPFLHSVWPIPDHPFQAMSVADFTAALTDTVHLHDDDDTTINDTSWRSEPVGPGPNNISLPRLLHASC